MLIIFYSLFESNKFLDLTKYCTISFSSFYCLVLFHWYCNLSNCNWATNWVSAYPHSILIEPALQLFSCIHKRGWENTIMLYTTEIALILQPLEHLSTMLSVFNDTFVILFKWTKKQRVYKISSSHNAPNFPFQKSWEHNSSGNALSWA